MGMLNWIHSNTSHLWPAVPLNPVFMESTTSFQNGLVNTSATSNNTNHSTISRWENLLGTRGQLNPSFLGFRVMCNDLGIVSRSTSNTATITCFLLKVANNGTFW